MLSSLKTEHLLVSKKDTVDGRNPAPFTGFYTSQVVQDFFHQQYYIETEIFQFLKKSKKHLIESFFC